MAMNPKTIHTALAVIILSWMMTLPLSVYAGDIEINTPEGVKMTFVITNSSQKTCEVESYCIDQDVAGTVTIPSNANGYTVTAIAANAFNGCDRITKVIVPNSIKTIGGKAFNGCKSLSAITIGNAVTAIGDRAFQDCSSLTSITLPNSIITIGEGTFYRCSSLTSIVIPDAATSIGASAFDGCKAMTAATIGSSVKSIGNRAFFDCNALKEVRSKIATPFDINDNVFQYEDNGIKHISATLYVPNGTKASYQARKGWNTFTNIVEMAADNISFADISVKSICVRNWDTNRDGELSITEAAAVKDLGTVFQNNSSIKSFNELQYFTSLSIIRDYAFSGCSSLTSVVIPNAVTSIGEWAFSECSALTTITIPESVITINMVAFYNCKALTSITIPNSVQTIGNAAFYYCSALTSITFSNSVKSIGDGAFEGCSSLTTITIPNSVTSIGEYAFTDCSGLTSVTLSNSMKSIGESAFSGCWNLTSITIPSSVTSIGDYAFNYCIGLISVTIPNSVTSIGEYAFTDCSGLKEVRSEILVPFAINSNVFSNYNIPLYVPAGTKAKYQAASGWKEFKTIKETGTPIDNITFADATVKSICVRYWDTNGDGELAKTEAAAVKSLGTVFQKNTTIKSFNELQYFTGLTTIGSSAFSDCSNLTSITIPNAVTSIENSAFSNCSGLKEVHITNLASWCNISFNSSDSNPLNYAHHLFLNGEEVKDLLIPNSVTSIGKLAFENCSGLTSVTIPNSVKSIGYGAFCYCSNLTTVTIGNSVTSIGNYAFYKCGSLPTVTIPNAVTSIGEFAFSDCGSLKEVRSEIKVPFDINSNVFSNYNIPLYVPAGTMKKYQAASGWKNFKTIKETGLVNITFADATVKSVCVRNWDTNGDGELAETEAAAVNNLGTVFQNNTNIRSFNELQYFTSLTTIESNAFSGCSNLTAIAIPNAVTSIGESAFNSCSALTAITIPNAVTTIGSYAFTSCISLTTITIPKSVTNLGVNPFINCSGLQSIKVESGNSVYDSRNNCNAIIETKTNKLVTGCKNTVFPSAVTSIGGQAFSGCSKLTTITIPNTVTSIGGGAFSSCSGLTSVTLPNSLKSIREYLFSECKGLTSITIPNSVTTIGDHAFYKCSSLTSITIPDAVTSIGEYAFSNCTGLKEVRSEIKVPFEINSNVFTNYNITLYIPIGTTAKYKALTGWKEFKTIRETGLENITFADANVKSVCVRNWDTNGDGELAKTEAAAVNNLGTVFQNNTNIKSFNELQYFTSLTTIGSNAFSGCSNLTVITIPNAVTTIGENAFYNCSSLTSFTFPSALKGIGDNAFSICTGLTTVFIPKSVTVIGINPFSATNLSSIRIEMGNTVYDSRGDCNAIVKTNNNELVVGCKSTVIGSNSNVKSIGESAFDNCIGLSSFSIPSTVTSIGKNAFKNCSGLTTITIPNSVTSIGEYAFSGCTSLKEVRSEIQVPFAINSNVFSNYNITLYVPTSTITKYKALSGWKEFKEIKDPNSDTPVENIVFADATVGSLCVENWDTNGDGKLSKAEAAAVENLGTVFKGKAISTFEELQYFTGLTTIAKTAFYNCSSLEAITIPSSVKSIESNAFGYCSSLTYITVPNSITTVSDDAFNSTGILSLKWESNTKLTTTQVSTFKKSQPNMLLFVKTESVLPTTGLENVVVNGTAESVVLEDNKPFYCIQAFTAKSATLTHRFNMTTGKGSAAGWETLALPFTVKTFTHATKGTLIPFANYNAGSNDKPFWLYELKSSGFVKAKTIEANKPYLISMPNNKSYSTDYCLNGNVTFSATNVTVMNTDDSSLTTVTYNGKTFIPTFMTKAKSNSVFAINATGDYSSVTGGQTAGSIFIRDLRSIRPFEAYFDGGAANSREFINIDFADEASTDIEDIIGADAPKMTRVYNLAGQQVYAGSTDTTDKVLNQLPAGIYIINGKKTIVK